MALDAVAEFLLRPLLEIVFYGVGYLTGRMILPVITLGRFRSKGHSRSEYRERRKRGARSPRLRSQDGYWMLDDDAVAFCGIVFWVLIIAGFIALRYFSQ
ncbi:MAG TPA: hypothetical protein VET30_00365 [Pseudoxanthomonas sp.]|nr:hypothetical protein [Pseudoxanthomonas sp.]